MKEYRINLFLSLLIISNLIALIFAFGLFDLSTTRVKIVNDVIQEITISSYGYLILFPITLLILISTFIRRKKVKLIELVFVFTICILVVLDVFLTFAFSQSPSELLKNVTDDYSPAERYYSLGMAHKYRGILKDQNIEISTINFQKSSDLGHIKSKVELGNTFLSEGKKVEAHRYFSDAAKSNEVAQMYLGIFYYHGWAVTADFRKARDFFDLAIGSNDKLTLANLYIGIMKYHGQGYETNKSSALNHFIKSAKNGNLEAKRNICIMLERNEVNKDIEKSKTYCEEYKKSFKTNDRGPVSSIQNQHYSKFI